MPGGEVLVARIVVFVAGFVPQFHAAFFATVAQPIDRRTGFVAEKLHQFLTEVAARVLRRHRDVFELVDLRAPLLLIAGIDGAQIFADARTHGIAVDADHLAACFRRSRYGKHAARAAPDDHNVGGHGGLDVLFRNFRGFTEPIAVFLRFGGLRRHLLHRDFALGLRDALGGRLYDGVRGDGSPRHHINLCRLFGENELLQHGGCRLADPRGFFTGINHHIRDLVLTERHRHDDVAADAGGLRRIRAGTVQVSSKRRTRRGCSSHRRTARKPGAQETAAGNRVFHIFLSSYAKPSFSTAVLCFSKTKRVYKEQHPKSCLK